jgi:hypothetical protein
MLVKNEKMGSDDIFNKIIDHGYENYYCGFMH